MNHTTITTVNACLALLFLASPATAQDSAHTESTVKGLSVGIHGSVTAPVAQDASLGRGLSLAIGYGLTERLAVHATTSGAWIGRSGDLDSFFQSQVDVEGRYSFGHMSGPWRPHVALGVRGRTLHQERLRPVQGGDTAIQMTVRPTAGAGVSYYISRSTSVDGSLRYTFGDVQRTRAFVGVSWYPRAR